MSGFILPIILFAALYLLLIRPQQKKLKAQQALVNSATAGDRVMLSSGIFGTITEVVDTACYVELAEGIEILVSKVFIQEILTEFPTEKALAADDEADDDEFDDDEVDLEDEDDEVDA